MDLTTPSFKEVTSSPEFSDALSVVFKRPFLRTEFDQLQMPNGVSHDEMWEFVQKILHLAAIIDPVKPWFKGNHGDHCWYYLSESVRSQLEFTGNLVAPESTLNLFLHQHPDALTLLNSFIAEEVFACAKRDGLTLSINEIASILENKREPHNEQERIIVNLRNILERMSQIASKNTVSHLLVYELNEYLNEGIDHIDFERPSLWPTELCDPSIQEDKEYISDVFDSVLMQLRQSRGTQSILISVLRSQKLLHCLNYVDRLPCLTEYLLRCAYSVIKRIPILMYIPLISNEDTKNNKYRKAHELEVQFAYGDGLCCTWDYAGSIYMLYLGIKSVEEAIYELVQTEQNIGIRIKKLPDLSERQRSFLSKALMRKNMQFTIQFYMKEYSVSYATARGELLKLHEKGLLSMCKNGRQFTFQANLFY